LEWAFLCLNSLNTDSVFKFKHRLHDFFFFLPIFGDIGQRFSQIEETVRLLALLVAMAKAVAAMVDQVTPPGIHFRCAARAIHAFPEHRALLVLNVLVPSVAALGRRAHMHLRVDKPTVQHLARTLGLARTQHLLVVAPKILGELIVAAFLETAVVAVQVHLIIDIALHEPTERDVRLVLHMNGGIAAPHRLVRLLHHGAQQGVCPVGAVVKPFLHQPRLGGEVSLAVVAQQHPGELHEDVALQLGQRDGVVELVEDELGRLFGSAKELLVLFQVGADERQNPVVSKRHKVRRTGHQQVDSVQQALRGDRTGRNGGRGEIFERASLQGISEVYVVPHGRLQGHNPVHQTGELVKVELKFGVQLHERVDGLDCPAR
jgi:hypothetical protein